MQSAVQNSIEAAVDGLAADSIDFLRDLVRIPSITGDEMRAQDYLARYLADLGLEVDTWRPSRSEVENHPAFSDDGSPLGDRPVIVGHWRGTDPKALSLILNGHIDVVPTGEESAWAGGPWSGAIRDGQLWGRGACDMKAGLAAGIWGIAALQRAGMKPKGGVLIQSVIGEETGGVGTLAALLRGYRADAAVILEPTSLEMCPIGAGAASFRLHVPGKSAHGAMRLEGVSAITKFYHLYDALEQLEHRRHAAFRHPFYPPGQLVAPLSVGKLTAGNWPSTVAELLVAEGRFGVLPGEDISSARRQFEAAIEAAADADPWLLDNRPRVEWFEGQFEPGETPASAPILKTLAESHNAICGKPVETHGVTYGSDLRLFTNNAGMHAVLYGPGDVNVAHSLNEHVPLDDVLRTAKVVALAVANWCGLE
jgi:acetylornithine deacetylase